MPNSNVVDWLTQPLVVSPLSPGTEDGKYYCWFLAAKLGRRKERRWKLDRGPGARLSEGGTNPAASRTRFDRLGVFAGTSETPSLRSAVFPGMDPGPW